jgi:hypothetical protein
VADIEENGKLDLITNGVSVLFGNGDGTFTSSAGPAFSPNGYIPLIADINNDFRLDLILTGLGPISSTVAVIPGVLGSPLVWNSGALTYTMAAGLGDFNNDGLIDVVTINNDAITNAPQFSVFLQTALNISPTLMNFGVVKKGTTSGSQSATLTNTGGAAISLTSITMSGANPMAYAMTTTCGSTLAAGANCTITASFSPNIAATRTAIIRVAYPGIGNPQFIELTGIGSN